jgi:RND family efflux transporter MFP subunit
VRQKSRTQGKNLAPWKWKNSPTTLAVVTISLSLCSFTSGCQEEPVETKPVARPVKIMVIEGQTAFTTLEYPGKVSPAQESYMAFEIPGRIISLPVKEGQDVRKGSILAKLDARDFQADYDAEVARLRQAKAEYQRYTALYEARNTSLSELQVKQRRFEVQKATVRQVQKALNDTRLVAPFSGRIAKKIVKDFQNVQAKETVLILQDNSTLEVVINVPERDWVAVKPELRLKDITDSSKAMFEITSIPNRRFPAWVKELATTADPETRTFEVTFGFNPPHDVTILPGMTARVILTPQSQNTKERGYVLPANAIASDENGEAYVWRVIPESMTVQRQPVSVAKFSGKTNIEVKAGLARGNWIAITGVHHLREGMMVRRLEELPQ